MREEWETWGKNERHESKESKEKQVEQRDWLSIFIPFLMFCFASFLFPGFFSCFLWVHSSPKIEREVITRDEPRSKKKRRRERQTYGRLTHRRQTLLFKGHWVWIRKRKKKRQVKYPKEFEGKIKQSNLSHHYSFVRLRQEQPKYWLNNRWSCVRRKKPSSNFLSMW